MKIEKIAEVATKINAAQLVAALVIIALGTIGMTLFFVDLAGM